MRKYGESSGDYGLLGITPGTEQIQKHFERALTSEVKKRAGWKEKVTMFLTLAIGTQGVAAAENRNPEQLLREKESVSEVYDYYSIPEPEMEKVIESETGEQNIYGMHMEINGSRMDRQSELEIREAVLELIDQMNQSELKRYGTGKALFYEAYITRGTNSDLQAIMGVDNGTLEEVIEKKKPKLGAIIRIGTTVAGVWGGKMGEIADIINRQLGAQIGPRREEYSEQNTYAFSVQATVDMYSQDNQGNPDPRTRKNKPVTLPYIIVEERQMTNSTEPQGYGNVRTNNTQYKLYMAEQLSGMLGRDSRGQTKVFYPDDGKASRISGFSPYKYGESFRTIEDAHKAATEHALLFANLELFGKESQGFNQAIEQLKRQETLSQPMEIPFTAEQERAIGKNKAVKLEMEGPMEVGQLVVINAPKKKYRGRVASSSKNPKNTYDVLIEIVK